ncbi:MAG: colicin V synthesis protein [Rubrivivax sp. SCN 71-131]|nr:MAG: colicin V synthesis protein [Rubrivivax sp. SCN 71-131]
MSWIDWALLAVLLLSVLVGVWRGLVFEVLSLAGWVVAWVGAQLFGRELAPWLPVGAPGSAANVLACFVVAFVGILIVWSLLARLARLLIHATPLSLPDRVLGGGFGLLRGGVLLLALATVLALTPAAQWAPWQQSEGARWLRVVLHGLGPLLPHDMARHLPT